MKSPASVDVQTFLDEQPFSPFQWTVFALCFVIVLLDGFDTAAIGYIAPSLLGEWGLTKASLAPVLSAALFGLAAGALFTGPLSDRLGRKTVLIGSVAVFGAACLASGFAHDLTTLSVLRFITGLGLGAAMPNAVTLTSEYSPTRRRALLTNAMFCGFPLGAAFGGFLAAWMIPHFGWRSVLWLGGVVPLVLLVAMVLLLPESVRFLMARGRPAAHIRAVLRRVSRVADGIGSFTTADAGSAATTGSGLRVVFSSQYRVGTLALWVSYFMGLVIFYALVNWMPVLFKDAGIEPRTATLVAALFPLGGVGAVLFGWLMDRFNANRIVAVGFALTALAVWGIGQVAGQVGTLVAAVFVAGAIMNTAQSSLPALAAGFYPTQGRATGVSWMMGIGRFGGIAGSFLVAQLAAQQLPFEQIFAFVAVPGVVAAVALVIKQFVHPAPALSRGAGPSSLAAH